MIAGRNRMMRKMIMDSITTDPEWKGGEYAAQPRGLIHALHVLTIMSSSALQAQKRAPDRDQADKALNDYIAGRAKDADANDLLYQVAASREYNPEPKLATIRAPLLAVNSADDVVNPPELGILERDIQLVPHGRAIVLPISDATRGHGTHTFAALWKQHLVELLAESGH